MSCLQLQSYCVCLLQNFFEDKVAAENANLGF